MVQLNSANQSLDIRLGSDLQFPINNNFEPIKGLNLLLQDIQQLLLTIPGERVGRPLYGCGLRAQMWENIDVAAIRGAEVIRRALELNEPRISVINVESSINTNTDLITFKLQFIVKTTDTKVNLVFPFRASQDLARA